MARKRSCCTPVGSRLPGSRSARCRSERAAAARSAGCGDVMRDRSIGTCLGAATACGANSTSCCEKCTVSSSAATASSGGIIPDSDCSHELLYRPLWAKLPAASSISNSRLRQVWYVLLPGSISGPSTTTIEFTTWPMRGSSPGMAATSTASSPRSTSRVGRTWRMNARPEESASARREWSAQVWRAGARLRAAHSRVSADSGTRLRSAMPPLAECTPPTASTAKRW
mmetsp:Transcript_36144/g.91209  ORF Transcript_36144/g.91209 Transcript_36144/m.91209 type:complete len:227 (-) Transcript_36144:1176-1856(-)